MSTPTPDQNYKAEARELILDLLVGSDLDQTQRLAVADHVAAFASRIAESERMRCAGEIAALLSALERLTESAGLLAAELTDPGTEAMASIYCAKRLVQDYQIRALPTPQSQDAYMQAIGSGCYPLDDDPTPQSQAAEPTDAAAKEKMMPLYPVVPEAVRTEYLRLCREHNAELDRSKRALLDIRASTIANMVSMSWGPVAAGGLAMDGDNALANNTRPACGGRYIDMDEMADRFLAERHDSDCARHNAPALPVGPCDCSLSPFAAREPTPQPSEGERG